MTKKEIIFIIILILLVFLILAWALFQKLSLKISPEKKISKETPFLKEIPSEKILSLTGVVEKIDPENNFLIIKATYKKDLIKINIAPDTKIFKVVFPKKKNSVFKTKREKITFKEVKPKDKIFIKSKKNIAGLKELNKIDYIEILP